MLTRSTYHKTPTSSNGTTVDGYLVGIVNTSDYSPFGVQLDGRMVFDGRYRYSFNGMESDDEVSGQGNSYDFGLRNYNPRIGRMFSGDPREAEYPWQSTYAYYANSPISTIDYLGGGKDDWIKNKDNEYIWDNTVTNPLQVHEGQTYIGKENSDIVKDLVGQTTFTAKTWDAGTIGSSKGFAYVATSYAKVFTTLNVSISANVSYDGDNRIFNGIDVRASGGAWTWASTNVFQKLDFTIYSLTLNGNDMSKDVYQPPTIGPQSISYKTVGIEGHNVFIRAQEVYSARNSLNNISVSLSGQNTFGGTPLKKPTAAGLILPPNITSISLTIPYKQ